MTNSNTRSVHGDRPISTATAVDHLTLVAEGGVGYTTATFAPWLERLETAADRLANLDPTELDEPAIRDALERLNRHQRRIGARISLLAGELVRREAARLNPQDPEQHHARQRAEAKTRRELSDRLGVTPSDAKSTTEAARGAARCSATRQAFEDGDLTREHVRQIERLLRRLGDQDGLEEQLLKAARRQHSQRFGETCRRLLAERNSEAARRDLDSQRTRRYGNAITDAHGMLHVRAGVVGIDAEIVATAIEAFRSKDRPGELRSPEQRTADALVDVCRTALDHAESTDHGNRPHVIVHVAWSDLVGDAGVAETTYVGPVPANEIRRLLDDSSISRVVTGPDSQPVDVGRASRTVPGPIWRAIVARDRHCTLDGCDAPPVRCQAAHLDRRWVEGAGTSVSETGLACWTCHDLIDRLGLIGKVTDGAVVWHHPDGRVYRRYRPPP